MSHIFNHMVKYSSKALDRIFQALSDSTRRKILLQLADRECTVSEIAEPYKMSLAAVSKHLKVLERAGLLKRTVDGRIHRCVLRPEPLQEANRILKQYEQFWGGQLDALETYLKQGEKK
jgi:DNA-binding transcriptional ArsR family regulator